MARFVDQIGLQRSLPQTPEEFQTCDHIRHVFGSKPDSIRSLSQGGSQKRQRAYIVKWRVGRSGSFEFICASGLLVGIPPKRPGQK
jgi:hypothetical protein